MAAEQVAIFRLPRSAYLAVLFLLVCAVPISFAATGDQSAHTAASWRLVFLAVPVIATIFIARTATFVSDTGIRVRAAFGSRRIGWDDLRGLSVTGRAVYAVLADGAVRLPCVRTNDLAAISRRSSGRLPEVEEARPKYAPSRRRRR